MTKNILHFPVAARRALICVWVQTGNPEQPLACKWMTRIPASAHSSALEGERSFGHILCA